MRKHQTAEEEDEQERGPLHAGRARPGCGQLLPRAHRECQGTGPPRVPLSSALWLQGESPAGIYLHSHRYSQ